MDKLSLDCTPPKNRKNILEDILDKEADKKFIVNSYDIQIIET
jgi:hypothetical protein